MQGNARRRRSLSHGPKTLVDPPVRRASSALSLLITIAINHAIQILYRLLHIVAASLHFH